MSLRAKPQAMRLLTIGLLPFVIVLATFYVAIAPRKPTTALIIYGAAVSLWLAILTASWAYERDRRRALEAWTESQIATIHRVLGAQQGELQAVRRDVNSKLITREWQEAFGRAEAKAGRPHLWLASGEERR
jgi:hypothetical protein